MFSHVCSGIFWIFLEKSTDKEICLMKLIQKQSSLDNRSITILSYFFLKFFPTEFIESYTKMDASPSPSTSGQKRHHSNETSPHPRCKSQRLSVDCNEPLTITDLNDNCLEKIFGNLDVCSLFNVATSNAYLRPAAGVAYKRKFGGIQVCIRNDRSSSLHRAKPHIFHKWIYVDGLKVLLPYLRCLGPSIRDLCVRYDGWTKTQCDLIHQYINEYCAGSLVNLEFRDKKSGNPIKHFGKPFISVRTVKAQDSHLGVQIPLFPQWFPNMRSLELTAAHIGWFSSQSMPFEHLEDVTIEINNGKRGFKTPLATRLLQLSPQLRNLTIRARTGQGIAPSTLSNIIKENPNISSLKVNTKKQKAFVTSSDIEQFLSEHKSLVELELVGYKFTVEAALLMLNQLNSLTKLRLELGSRSEYTRIVSQLDSKWQPVLHEWFGNFCMKLQS